ncbi:ABC transporter substrate-binding protein [Haliangium sp.]|uniref:ABC transporter substrate-binding protein n=1 Tax=Haliangium sp. TaxID=2663208 RepID=UPI003D0B1DBB
MCADDGFCVQPAIIKRCEETFPEDLFRSQADRLKYKDYVIVGSVFDNRIGLFVQWEKAIQLAYSQVNSNAYGNGIDGQRGIGVILCDAATDEEPFDYGDGITELAGAAEATANWLANDMKVPAIVGVDRSGSTQAAFQAIQSQQVVMVSPSSTSPTLTGLDPASVTDEAPGFLWRTAPPDSFQSKAIAKDMLSVGNGRTTAVTNVAALYLDDAYSVALYEAFLEAFLDNGGTEVVPFAFSEETLAEAVRNAGEANVQEVLVISSDLGQLRSFLNLAADRADYDDKTLFFTEAAATAEVLQGTSDEATNPALLPKIRATRPEPRTRADATFDNFVGAYTDKFPDGGNAEDIFTANAFDAAWVVALGVAWAHYQENEITGLGVARGLRKLSNKDGMTANLGSSSGWSTAQQQFRSGRAININGASGSLDFSLEDEETGADIQIWVVDDVSFEAVKLYTIFEEELSN